MGVIKQLTNWGGAILYVCLNILEYIRIHIHIHICNYIYTHMYAYIYTYMYLYIYIYMCVYTFSLSLSLSLITRKCTPRKTGTVLEPCWNLSLLGCKAGLIWLRIRVAPRVKCGTPSLCIILHPIQIRNQILSGIWQPIFLASGFSFWYLLHLRHFLMQVFVWPHPEVKWVCVNIRCTHVR